EDAVLQLEADRMRLRNYDITDEQIAELADTREVRRVLAIHSPAGGIVTDKMALEGMYVKPGMKLYTIADLSRVWVYVDIYEYQLPWVSLGQTATMTLPYVPGRVFVGKVVYIYPYLEQQSRVIKVRLEFENANLELKPGMYANITLAAAFKRDALLVPREAYIDSGTRKVAFVDSGEGKFSPRDIQTGVEAEEGMVEVLYGLDVGEVVVTSGQFMLDAESKLKEAVAKMMEPERAAPAKDGPTTSPLPTDAAYACPMEEHPDEADPAKQGAYFSAEPGECPWCGMALKPLAGLRWVQARQAAQGGEVAYACPDHPHMFSGKSGRCPRCGHDLAPFKVMYTCRTAEHSGVVSTFDADCPRCQQSLVAFRGLWLDQSMADANVPPNTGPAHEDVYQCPVHPLVHSDRPGQCTICAAPLQATQLAEAEASPRHIPAGARYTCPMDECWHFTSQPGECPECGMNLKPLEQIDWAREMLAQQGRLDQPAAFVCPMHPDQAQQEPSLCPVCGMQLVRRELLTPPATAPDRVARQVDFITEHYLNVQRLLASDRTDGVARNALGLVGASEELARSLTQPGVAVPAAVAAAVEQLHAAALKVTGESIEADRVTFVALSAAMRALVEHIRPDAERWPKLYIYHCPMSKGDWLQASEKKTNPYYGFKMLRCGELQGTK
ncbi:MAG: efflux RND transporter periplasmic adaptor subunit, partial [Planctomycetota bacterium]